MMEVLEKKWTSVEYLAFERASRERHELINGKLIKKQCSNFNHNILASNLSFLFNQLFSIEDIFVAFQSNMRIADLLKESYFYPDLVILDNNPVCEDEYQDTLTNPILIVEIMSKSTQRYDKVEKFEIYKNLDSVKEYMLVSQDQIQIKVFRKISKNHWELFEYEELSDEVEVLNGTAKIALKSIYNKVKFEK